VGKAVKIGRGPATVIGISAESQATLPRRRGWAYFAREYASVSARLLAGFFISILAEFASGRFVQHAQPKYAHSARLLAFFALGWAVFPLHAQSAAPPATPPAMREVVDEFGRTVRIPQLPQRIVSLAPNLTETLYALGVQDRLVGDTDYCDYPDDAKRKTKVGGVINPSLEEIAALHPDLVLVTKEGNRADTVRALDTLGIPAYATQARNVHEVLTTTQKLANLLGVPEAGSSLTADLQAQLDALHAKLEAIPPTRALFIVWTEPLISVGKDTFVADALRLAGATSIVDAKQDWPQMSLEEIAKLQPEYLVFASGHFEDGARDFEALANRPGWRILEAVRNRRFAVVSEAVIRPAPRIVSAIQELARQLHPAAFPETPAPNNPGAPAAGQPGAKPPANTPPARMALNTQIENQELACAR